MRAGADLGQSSLETTIFTEVQNATDLTDSADNPIPLFIRVDP